MEMELIKVSEKGQVVIPNSLRRAMNIQKSDQLLIFGEGNTIILKKVEKPAIQKSFDELSNPIKEAVKKSGFTRKDLSRIIKEVRNNA